MRRKLREMSDKIAVDQDVSDGGDFPFEPPHASESIFQPRPHYAYEFRVARHDGVQKGVDKFHAFGALFAAALKIFVVFGLYLCAGGRNGVEHRGVEI